MNTSMIKNAGSKGPRNASLIQYANCWGDGRKPPGGISGIQGRFIRMAPGQPDALTDDPDRRVVFLVNAETCVNLIGLSGYEVCITIGWLADYTRDKVNAGYRFAFVTFPENECKLGTWDNVLDEVEALYPEVARKLAKHRAALRKMTTSSIKEIEGRLGYRFIDADKNKSDPRFMTIARYAAAADTADSARAFLYHTVHLKELFYGDGWTRNNQGQRGCEEFIMGARPMNDLGEHFVADIHVTVPKVTTTPRKKVASELPIPDFFRAENAAEWGYQPLLQATRPGQTGLFEYASRWRKQHAIAPAATDAAPVTFLVIDAQLDFTNPLGTLYVGGHSGNGAIDDCARTAEFVYANLNKISRVIPTADTHLANQIFFSSFWVDANGEPVGAHRTISVAQIDAGEVRVAPAMAALANGNYGWLCKQARHYCAELERAGKYQLYIWPPHCILGSQGHALNGVVFEAAMFHAYVRQTQLTLEIKGAHPFAENYSVLGPEVLTRHDGLPMLQKNTAIIKTLLDSRAVIIAGQAASHCVKSSIDDILSEIQAVDPALARKIYVMEDLTSSVVVPDSIDPATKLVTKGVDFTPEADKAFAKFRAAGMNLVKSTTPMESWPNFPHV